MEDKKKLALFGVLALCALGLALFMGMRSMAGPGETVAGDSSHLGDKGYK